MTVPPEEMKACCAAAHGSELVVLLLGDSYHPGGQTLTRRLARHLELPAGARVLDIASGGGVSAVLLARDYGLLVTGVDLSPANVALARGRANAEGLADRVTFTVGDAERLPYPDKAFDAVVIECALCTFPNKPAAASESARVLRPAGKLGLTDVVAEPSRLPAELTTLAARIACIADAVPLPAYGELLRKAGLPTQHTERHDVAIIRMFDQIEARLTVPTRVRTEREEHLSAGGTAAKVTKRPTSERWPHPPLTPSRVLTEMWACLQEWDRAAP